MSTGWPQEQQELRRPHGQPDEAWPDTGDVGPFEHPSGPIAQYPSARPAASRQAPAGRPLAQQPSGPYPVGGEWPEDGRAQEQPKGRRGSRRSRRSKDSDQAAASADPATPGDGDDDQDLEWIKYLTGAGSAGPGQGPGGQDAPARRSVLPRTAAPRPSAPPAQPRSAGPPAPAAPRAFQPPPPVQQPPVQQPPGRPRSAGPSAAPRPAAPPAFQPPVQQPPAFQPPAHQPDPQWSPTRQAGYQRPAPGRQGEQRQAPQRPIQPPHDPGLTGQWQTAQRESGQFDRPGSGGGAGYDTGQFGDRVRPVPQRPAPGAAGWRGSSAPQDSRPAVGQPAWPGYDEPGSLAGPADDTDPRFRRPGGPGDVADEPARRSRGLRGLGKGRADRGDRQALAGREPDTDPTPGRAAAAPALPRRDGGPADEGWGDTGTSRRGGPGPRRLGGRRAAADPADSGPLPQRRARRGPVAPRRDQAGHGQSGADGYRAPFETGPQPRVTDETGLQRRPAPMPDPRGAAAFQTGPQGRAVTGAGQRPRRPFETGPQGWTAFETGPQAGSPFGADPRMGGQSGPQGARQRPAGPVHSGEFDRPQFETGPQAFETGPQRRSGGGPIAGGQARRPSELDPASRDQFGAGVAGSRTRHPGRPQQRPGPPASHSGGMPGSGYAAAPAGRPPAAARSTPPDYARSDSSQPGSARSATQTLTPPAPAGPGTKAPAKTSKKARKAAAQQAARSQAGGRTATGTAQAVRTAPGPAATQPRQAGATQRRRARTIRARLALGTISVVVVGLSSFALSMHFLKHSTGPAHVLATPQQLGPFTQDPALAAGMGAGALKSGILARSGGEATHVVDAVYQERPRKGATSGPQIILFIGGNLTGTSANAFISSFTGKLSGAVTTSPGSLGGAAACVPSMNGKPAECAWADNDTFGVITSPNLGATALANELRAARPLLEHQAG